MVFCQYGRPSVYESTIFPPCFWLPQSWFYFESNGLRRLGPRVIILREPRIRFARDIKNQSFVLFCFFEHCSYDLLPKVKLHLTLS